jgi:RHS repeat-associated protein
MQSLSVKKNEVASSTVSQFTYTVNHLGQRTGVTTTGSAFANVNRGWTWGYDALGQVTKAVHAAAPATLDRAYAYDNIGNRTSSTDGSGGGATTVAYTPDRLNQYDTINPGAPADPVYDLDGNLKEDAGINAMGYGLKLEWDAENRVTAVRKADNTLLVTYVYDYLGRRIRKTTTAAAYQGASDIAYLYEGWNVVAEYAIASGPAVSLAQAYTWGLDLSGSGQGAGGVGGLLCIHRGPGTDGSGNRTWADAFYPTYDGNGNVSEYLDQDGDEVAHFEYDPFGRIAASSGSVADFTYRFSTKPQDFETGLYYYGYRYYDPVTGRWPSRDPIGERGGANLYGFLINDSLSHVDFLGLELKKYIIGSARVLKYDDADADKELVDSVNKSSAHGWANGFWDSNWGSMADIASCDGCALKLSGELIGHIYLLPTFKHKMEATLTHERHHEKIEGDLWNLLADHLNPLDGMVFASPEKCGQVALAANFLSMIYYQKAYIEHTKFDISEYELKPQEKQQERQDLLDRFEEGLKVNLEILKESIDEIRK